MGLQSKLTQRPVGLESHIPELRTVDPYIPTVLPILWGFYPLTWGRGLSGGSGGVCNIWLWLRPTARVRLRVPLEPWRILVGGLHLQQRLYYEFWNVCVLLVEWWEKLPGMVCCHQGVNELEELLL